MRSQININGAEQHGDSDDVFVVYGADLHGHEDGVAVLHLRDDNYYLIGLLNLADGDLATGRLPSLWSDTCQTMEPRNTMDPTPLHHRPTPMPPCQGVWRSTTGPHCHAREIAPRKNGDDHLANTDLAPLCQPLWSGREITPCKNGDDDHLTDGGPTPLRQPLRHDREIAPAKNGSDNHLTNMDPAPLHQPCLRLWDTNAGHRRQRACPEETIFRWNISI